MKKFLISFLLLTSLSAPAMANDLDMSTFRCNEFAQNAKANTYILMWIDGYVSAVSEKPVISEDWLDKLSDHIVNACLKNPDTTIMDIINSLD